MNYWHASGSYDVIVLYMCREREILEPLSHFTDTAGNVINITIVITSGNCTDKKYNKSLLLRKLEEEVTIFNKILPNRSVYDVISIYSLNN